MALVYSENADTPRGREIIDRIMDDMKLLQFDGIHTLKFVFNSRRVTNLCKRLEFRLNRVCGGLEDTDSDLR